MRMCYSLAIVAMVVATAMARPEHHVGHRQVDKYYNSVPRYGKGLKGITMAHF